MNLCLKGKCALVTGASGGLGRAVAEALAAEGVNVAAGFHSKEKETQEFAGEMSRRFGTECVAVKADMAKKDEVKTLFDSSRRALGKIDILVNNAGIWLSSYIKDMPEEDFEKTLAVDLEAPFLLCREMVNHLLDRKSKGKIINVVSQAAFHGSTTGHAHYAAAKGGLVIFTVSLAREVAPYGINCNCVAPGIMRTPMMGKALSSGKGEKYYEDRIPLGRIAEPREVAYPVLFLASDKADYITGATIDVSGGMLMR